ncbi:hypothetical protein HDU96_002593 [Phlyctochytrium bullatum]|nr:hypothetical protein HDU96_002593 [Phlyctochytrium bullatum]
MSSTLSSVITRTATATATALPTIAFNRNGEQLVFTQVLLNRVAIKVSAITLTIVNIFVFFRCFKNKKSSVALLALAFILLHFIGVILQFLPDIQVTDSNHRQIIWGGVGCFMLSSELFVWCLFVRFTIVAPFQRTLQIIVKTWMILESLAILANYVVWCYFAEVGDRDGRRESAQAYSYLSIVQSVTAGGLSGYFMMSYYWPRLKSIQGSKLWLKLWTSGFFYLTLEVLLHCCYTVSFKISSIYYSSATTVATALRHSLFLLFVYQIRHASKVATTFGNSDTGSSSKSSNHLSSHSHHGGGGNHHSRHATVDMDHKPVPLTTFDTSNTAPAPHHTVPHSYPAKHETVRGIGASPAKLGGSVSSSHTNSTVFYPYNPASLTQPSAVLTSPTAYGSSPQNGGLEYRSGLSPTRTLPPEREERYYQNL